MKLLIFKKVDLKRISLIILFAVVGNIFVSNQTFAIESFDTKVSSNQLILDKVSKDSSIYIINEDIYNLIYLQEIDGETYRIEEKTDESFSKIDSKIYILNEYGEDQLIENIKTTVDYENEKIESKVYMNDNQLKNTFYLDMQQQLDNVEGEINIQGKLASDDKWKNVGSWKDRGYSYGNNNFAIFTVTVVTAYLVGVLSYKFLPATKHGAGLKDAASTAAGFVVGMNSKRVYFKRHHQSKYGWAYGTREPQLRASKNTLWIYKDSRRTNLITKKIYSKNYW